MTERLTDDKMDEERHVHDRWLSVVDANGDDTYETCVECDERESLLHHYEEALREIKGLGVASDAKGTHSKRVVAIARKALTPTEGQT